MGETNGPIAVIGAGLQGACIALELARRGRAVHLFEAEASPFTQASRGGEGKLHCGFTYAKDGTGRTTRVMHRGALAFSGLIARWAETPVPAGAFSAPFWYAVHRDSLLPLDAIANHFARVERDFVESASLGGSYPGWSGGGLFDRVPTAGVEAVFSDCIVGAFRTAEVAVDPEAIGRLLVAAITASDRIEFLPNARVSAVEGEDLFTVLAGGSRHGPYRHVVNATWAGRLELDATRGIVPGRPWLFRYKMGVELSGVEVEDLPSTTIVQGPFGDILHRGGGRWYLSWYPACRLAASDAIAPNLVFDEADRMEQIEPTLAAMEGIAPAVARLRSAQSVGTIGGIIFSWGDIDIDAEETPLHVRHDIGPESHGNYHTVNTGKFTTAPIFAVEMADRITGAT